MITSITFAARYQLAYLEASAQDKETHPQRYGYLCETNQGSILTLPFHSVALLRSFEARLRNVLGRFRRDIADHEFVKFAAFCAIDALSGPADYVSCGPQGQNLIERFDRQRVLANYLNGDVPCQQAVRDFLEKEQRQSEEIPF